MWHRLVRNALSNVGGTIVGLAVGFVTMPLVVHHLGAAEFGLWVLATSLVGYLSVLDLGLSPTLVNAAAALLARDEESARERLSETASTIFTTYAVLGALGGTGLVAVGWLAGSIFQVPPKTPSEPPFITYWLMRRSSVSVKGSVGLMIKSARRLESISSATFTLAIFSPDAKIGVPPCAVSSVPGMSFGSFGSAIAPLHVQVPHVQGVVLDELPPWFHLVSHQFREHLLRLHRVGQIDP